MRAIVLLSGGIDSAATAAMAIKEGYELDAITFDYAQRHRREIQAAKLLAAHLEVNCWRLCVVHMPYLENHPLAITGQITKDRTDEERETIIAPTYVPARNTIFLSLALGYAETIGAQAIFIGATRADAGGYPDCRSRFFEQFYKVAKVGTRIGLEQGISIRTPLIQFRKPQVIQIAYRLGIPFDLTWSCYDPQPTAETPIPRGDEPHLTPGWVPCGTCDPCILREQGFAANNLEDPLRRGS